ncbi:L-threonine 3-O-phosphate decarboxylase [Mucinivorans hirudinis]|uniref:Aminotransferase n=1 Tax=Mucinivorans hirudinis TaxID=1433126 RepID=A0A060RE63_9BACT|nr:L-threonine 3-O-phosphate decarboxylase [Mucinivorans hirudinis]
MIEGHGNNIYDYSEAIGYDFSSNVAFNGNSDEIVNFLKGNLDCIKNYPDPCARRLSSKIAQHCSEKSASILVTGGAAEAFYLLAQLLGGARSAIMTPSFAEYEDACRLHKHHCTYIDISQFSKSDFSPYRSVWLGNPNNPDATLIPATEILSRCHAYPDTLFIVDYAYQELTQEKQLIEISGKRAKNLILTHSLTKSFAIPGIRLGYIVASAEIIAALSRGRAPWSVNSLALEAGCFIMDNYNRLLPNIEELMGESLFLQRELRQNPNLESLSSRCNFFLSRLKNGSAAELKERLVREFGILIRDASNFRGLDESYFRLGAQSRTANIKLIEAINKICK